MNRFFLLAASKGWWDDCKKPVEECDSNGSIAQLTLCKKAVESKITEKLCLIHSEVSEALEDFRDNKLETTFEENGKPVGMPTELADIVIRTYDLAGAMGIDLDKEIDIKHGFNKLRPHRHGGKRC